MRFAIPLMREQGHWRIINTLTLPPGGPSGQVFWNQEIYPLMDPANPLPR